MLSVSRKLDAVGERILNISSIERREFTLLLKVFFDGGHEHISQLGTKRGSHSHAMFVSKVDNCHCLLTIVILIVWFRTTCLPPLFTNVPLDETIEILADRAFTNNWFNTTCDLNLTQKDLVDLLGVAPKDNCSRLMEPCTNGLMTWLWDPLLVPNYPDTEPIASNRDKGICKTH